ncbi:cytochrome c oxidase subunit 3 [Parashewanella tropica]|uniref:cytochrome c oxidase subunit 3 n=1 Tax=Parashewanella tropica TaxID=2547970 RepID=UPI00105926B5|nr:cytochrome c oxidase subunit 3 [Parashewanella tropica]
MSTHEHYYVPAQSGWPIVGAIGLFLIAFGAGHYVAQIDTYGHGGWGIYVLLAGIATILYMITGWFRTVINESMTGLYSSQMDRSFRQGMSWFIFSEVMFFGAFFGALFFIRMFSVPWLGGEFHLTSTHEFLWPNFVAEWPLTKTPKGDTTQAMPWHGLPLYNTIILLTSSVTLHFAHVALEKGKRSALKAWLAATILLGLGFLYLQAHEYIHAYTELGLTLESGVYGNTFFMLTGFHGMHVTIGTIFLITLFFRILKGHFTPDQHFAFQAGSWYWHFVDVVWLCLFVFVYVL